LAGCVSYYGQGYNCLGCWLSKKNLTQKFLPSVPIWLPFVLVVTIDAGYVSKPDPFRHLLRLSSLADFLRCIYDCDEVCHYIYLYFHFYGRHPGYYPGRFSSVGVESLRQGAGHSLIRFYLATMSLPAKLLILIGTEGQVRCLRLMRHTPFNYLLKIAPYTLVRKATWLCSLM